MIQYIKIIEDYYRTREIITFDDLKFLDEENFNYFVLLKKFISDSRFLKLGDEFKYGNFQLVKKKFLLNKLIYLNIILGKNNLKTISYENFSFFLSPLFPKELGKEDIELIIFFAGKFSLAYKRQDNKLIFPFSYLIYKIYSKINNFIFILFHNSLENYKNEVQIINKILSLFEEFTDLYFEKNIYYKIFTERIAPKTKKAKTLEEIGLECGVTRERIRQIGVKINDRLLKSLNNLSFILINNNFNEEIIFKDNKAFSFLKLFEALILFLICLKGSNLINKKYFEVVNRLKFLLNFLNIEVVDNYFKDYYLIDVSINEMDDCFNEIKNSKIFDLYEISKCLSKKFEDKLIENDITNLSKLFKEKYSKSMTGIDAAYISLKKLGGVAHYTQIAKKCVELFKYEEKFSPRNVLAYLTREPNFSRGTLPWVWIGSRGVYGLKELGYTRPEKSLYDEVAKIVQDEFAKSNKPVSFSKIKVEISKSRPFINENSLLIACSFNEKIKYLGKIKCCVPIEFAKDFGINEIIEENNSKNNEVNEDFIDKILSEYKE